MPETPEILQAAQSITIDIHNRPDGKFAVLTFFTLGNGAANPNNSIIARLGLPYEALVAMPGMVQELIRQNDAKLLESK